MWTNSEKPSRKYRHALWLATALFLVSCSPQKRLMRAEVQTQINESVKAHFDSLVRAQVAMMLERLTVSEGETVTDLVVYDTDKPAADSTGLPSVKAVLHKEHRQKQQSRETAQASDGGAGNGRYGRGQHTAVRQRPDLRTETECRYRHPAAWYGHVPAGGVCPCNLDILQTN